MPASALGLQWRKFQGLAGGGGRAACYKGEQGLVFALVHQDSPGRLSWGGGANGNWLLGWQDPESQADPRAQEHPQDTSDLGMDTSSSCTVSLGLVGASHFTVSPKGRRGNFSYCAHSGHSKSCAHRVSVS